jgi:hypothetical protein
MTAEELIARLSELSPQTEVLFGDGRLLILSFNQILPVGQITGPESFPDGRGDRVHGGCFVPLAR